MEEEANGKSMTIEAQCSSKLWKTRLKGYEQAVTLFNQIQDKSSAEWQKYLTLVPLWLADSNVPAQEKGMEAALLFLEKSKYGDRIVDAVMTALVSKCFASAKAKIKELALQITLKCIAMGKQDEVISKLLQGTGHKNPKVIIGCTSALRNAVLEFGTDINVRPILNKLGQMLSERDKLLKDESKALTIELYRWVGADVKPHLATVQPIIVAELETEFQKLPKVRSVPKKIIGGGKQKPPDVAPDEKKNLPVNGNTKDSCDGEIVDVLRNIPSSFFETIQSPKWQERKETLEGLLNIVKAPKLCPGDYSEVVRVLKTVVGLDANVLVVIVAAKCLTSLAEGLKKSFYTYASSCISVIIEKFKEKKQNVIAALREAIDAIYICTTIDAIMEDTIKGLGCKNPAVKTEVTYFLARAFARTPATAITKKVLKAYVPAFIKNLNDSDKLVRETPIEALGVLMKLVGQATLQPYLSDIDNSKIGKIEQYSETATLCTNPHYRRATKSAVQTSTLNSQTPKPKTVTESPSKKLLPTIASKDDDLSQFLPNSLSYTIPKPAKTDISSRYTELKSSTRPVTPRSDVSSSQCSDEERSRTITISKKNGSQYTNNSRCQPINALKLKPTTANRRPNGVPTNNNRAVSSELRSHSVKRSIWNLKSKPNKPELNLPALVKNQIPSTYPKRNDNLRNTALNNVQGDAFNKSISLEKMQHSSDDSLNEDVTNRYRSDKDRPTTAPGITAPGITPPVKTEPSLLKPPAARRPTSDARAQRTAPSLKPTSSASNESNADQIMCQLSSEDYEEQITLRESLRQASSILPAHITSGMVHPSWTMRLSSMKEFMALVTPMEKSTIPTQAVIRTILRTPGLKDSSVDVLKIKLDAICMLALNAKFTNNCVDLVIDDVTEQLEDPKICNKAMDTLSAIGEGNRLEYVCLKALRYAFDQNNPQIKKAVFNWISKCLNDFGYLISPNLLLKFMLDGVEAAHSDVRCASIALASTFYQHLGDQFGIYFKDVDPPVQQVLQQEFRRVKKESPPKPVRGLLDTMTVFEWEPTNTP